MRGPGPSNRWLRWVALALCAGVLAAASTLAVSSLRRAQERRRVAEEWRRYRQDQGTFRELASAAMEHEAELLVVQVEPAVTRSRKLLGEGDAAGALAAVEGVRVRLKALVDAEVLQSPEAAIRALASIDAVVDAARLSQRQALAAPTATERQQQGGSRP